MSRVVATSVSSGGSRTPGWLNPRVIAGVVLVLVATVVGALVVGRAQRTDRVWSMTRALAPGIVLRADDLQSVNVRLPGNRALTASELLPRSALSATGAGTTVSVPLPSGDAPPVTRGQRVRLWLSTHRWKAVVVLADVAVQEVTNTGGGTFGTGNGETVVLRVPPNDASRVVQALGIDSAVVRAAVLTGPSSPEAQSGSLAGCAGA